MSSVHTPQRLPNESLADYKQRRKASKAANARATLADVGPQRKMPSSREQLRNSQRKNGTLRGIYGRGLLNHFNRKRLTAIVARNAKRMAAL